MNNHIFVVNAAHDHEILSDTERSARKAGDHDS